jgi:hypothetical protein
MTATILLLVFIVYVIAIDQNVADYIYLRLVRVPLITLQSKALQLKLYVSLRWDIYMMRRGVVPKKFYDMASEIRNSLNDPD